MTFDLWVPRDTHANPFANLKSLHLKLKKQKNQVKTGQWSSYWNVDFTINANSPTLFILEKILDAADKNTQK